MKCLWVNNLHSLCYRVQYQTEEAWDNTVMGSLTSNDFLYWKEENSADYLRTWRTYCMKTAVSAVALRHLKSQWTTLAMFRCLDPGEWVLWQGFFHWENDSFEPLYWNWNIPRVLWKKLVVKQLFCNWVFSSYLCKYMYICKLQFAYQLTEPRKLSLF